MSEESWKKEFYPVDASKVSRDKAIKHSLVKWYGLREENLKKHGLTKPPVYIDDDSCALCQTSHISCSDCPLFEYVGDTCRGSIGIYGAYCYGSNPEPMIEALEAISFVEDVCK